MDSTCLSTTLMKLLEGIGTNESAEKILPIIDSMIAEIENICKKANELDYVKAHREAAQKPAMSESDKQLQSLVDQVYERYKQVSLLSQ